MEFLYSLLGLRLGSPTRLLYDSGIHTTINTLADQVKEEGYLVVPIPFSWLPTFITGPVKNIVLIRDLKMAHQIGSYGAHDPHLRLPFEMTDIVVGGRNISSEETSFPRYVTAISSGRNITSRNDYMVAVDRSRMKKILHDFPRIKEVIQEVLGEFIEYNTGKEINVEKEFMEWGTKIIGKSILGIQKFPPEDQFKEMVSLLEETDDALTNFQLKKLPLLREQLEVHSKQLLEDNRDTLLGKDSVFPYIINGDIEEANVATIFLVTSNINRLLYLTLIFLGCNPEWQEKVRKAFQERDEDFLSGMYKEMCRLFIPTQFPRFASVETEFQGAKFPPGSLFLALGRAIRMDPEIYPNPLTCDPTRYQEKDIRMNTVELAPFGLGPRQCPASAQFTEKFWLTALEYLLYTRNLQLVVNKGMEYIPPLVSQIILTEEYIGSFKERA